MRKKLLARPAVDFLLKIDWRALVGAGELYVGLAFFFGGTPLFGYKFTLAAAPSLPLCSLQRKVGLLQL